MAWPMVIYASTARTMEASKVRTTLTQETKSAAWMTPSQVSCPSRRKDIPVPSTRRRLDKIPTREKCSTDFRIPLM